MGRPRPWLVAAPIVLAIAFASCGLGSDDAASDETTPDPSTTAAPSTTEGADATTSTVADPEPETTTETVEAVVYADDFATSIQPIFADRCTACHSPGGPGTTEWVLATVSDIADYHEDLTGIITGGSMPPWPAGGESPPFHGDRSLRDDQIQAIVDWSAAGGPLDVDPDTPVEAPHGVVGLDSPDTVLTAAEPYAGSTAVTDDYRCLVFDPELADGGWITGYQFIPDATEVVHHAIGYLLPAEARSAAAELDGSDGKPGWQCYGSSGLGRDDIFLGWAPGQDPSVMPDGAGLWIEPDAFIVLQIHYHYDPGEEVPADASELAIRLAADDELDPVAVTEYIAPAEIPCGPGEEGPLCDRDAALAAAIERYGQEGVQADRFLQICGQTPADYADMTDGTASSSCDISVALVGGTGEVVSVLGHQHEIGSWFRMTLNPGTGEEKVLLDIPDWDFDWQYNYRPMEQIVIDNDDVVRVECGWDRSRRDPALDPAYVLWADGTNDEMCFATITTRPVG